MKKGSDIGEAVRTANREVYNRLTPEEYDRNESIFDEDRQRACRSALEKLAQKAGNGNFLDIGMGTGNLLSIAGEYFDKCYGTDIAEELLVKVRDRYPGSLLFASDAEQLPVKGESIDVVSCYALLHHLYSHENLFRECHRILRKGGMLYTDHDPNYYLCRFYYPIYRLKHFCGHGFGSEKGDLAEYHHSKTPGIDPEKLRAMLLEIGFAEVDLKYRMTDRKTWSFPSSAGISLLRKLSRCCPSKSFFTHFRIFAVK